MYTGKKVRLREYKKEDVKQAQNFMNDSEIKRLLQPGIPYLYTFEDEEKWFEGLSAMKVLIKFIFEQMNIHKIKLNVYSFNERAIKSYEKCGFKQEGRLRKEIFRDGKYYDEIVMGLLSEEYFG